MSENTKVWSVSDRTKNWTKEAIELSFFIKKGAKIHHSRRIGDFDLYINGYKMAILFKSQKDQIDYLVKNNFFK